MKPQGFTLIELVVVIIVMGILSITILPRFADKTTFNQTGFREQLLLVLTYARKQAIANRRYVCVTGGGGGVSLMVDPQNPEGASVNCASSVGKTTLLIPGTGAAILVLPTGSSGITLTVTGSPFYFDPLGRASASGISFSVSGQTIQVDQETGYAR